jgi:hypothetical protein
VILEQLGYLASAATKLELLRTFERVFEQLRPKERIAIIVDEAQALSAEMLEELRLFSNYARDSKGHLEILLVGARVVDASHGAVAPAVSSAYWCAGGIESAQAGRGARIYRP